MSAEGVAQDICAGPSDLDFLSLTTPRPYVRGYSLPALCASLFCVAWQKILAFLQRI